MGNFSRTLSDGRLMYLALQKSTSQEQSKIKKPEGNWGRNVCRNCFWECAGQLLANRPFPSSKKSHFQSEAKCEAIDMKMIFNYDANKIHNKGFALSLVLKVRFFGTRKWPIFSLSQNSLRKLIRPSSLFVSKRANS